MTYIFKGIHHWSLIKASKRLKITIEELINIAEKNRITLSVLIPKDCDLWIMTTPKKIDPMEFRNNIKLPSSNLIPEKTNGVLVNLSSDDCLKLQHSTLQQGRFESSYASDNTLNISVLNLKQANEPKLPDRLIVNDKYTLNLSEEIKKDNGLVNSLDMGLKGLSFEKSNLTRSFVLVKKDFSMPFDGIGLCDAEILDINESDLYIADQELSKYEELKNNRDEKKPGINPKREPEIWCSDTLKELLDFSIKMNTSYKNKKEYKLKSEEHRVHIEDTLLELKKIKQRKSEIVDFFLKLSAPDNLFYEDSTIVKIKEKLGTNLDTSKSIPTAIQAIIKIAKEAKTEEQESDRYPKSEIDLKPRLIDLGFTTKLAKYSALILHNPKKIH